VSHGGPPGHRGFWITSSMRGSSLVPGLALARAVMQGGWAPLWGFCLLSSQLDLQQLVEVPGSMAEGPKWKRADKC
jgi:hypothetical protein